MAPQSIHVLSSTVPVTVWPPNTRSVSEVPSKETTSPAFSSPSFTPSPSVSGLIGSVPA